jgi:hypothetical protein
MLIYKQYITVRVRTNCSMLIADVFGTDAEGATPRNDNRLDNDVSNDSTSYKNFL